MCQLIVFGTDYGTRKFDLGSRAEFLCKKSLFYGPVDSYFAAYDSVVLTGPCCVSRAFALAPNARARVALSILEILEKCPARAWAAHFSLLGVSPSTARRPASAAAVSRSSWAWTAGLFQG